ncbi:MAG: ATP-dependent DNA ligase [Candidatus Nezhaarchaeales archaeon]
MRVLRKFCYANPVTEGLLMVLFVEVCRLCDELESTSSRSSMVASVSSFIRGLEAHELELAVRFIIGEIFPPWEPEIGLGASGVIDCVVKAFESSKSKLFKAFKSTGDLGLASMIIAEKRKSTSPLITFEKDLTIKEVHEVFKSVARASGEGSRHKKLRLFHGLLLRAKRPIEVKYLVKLALGERRHGFSEGLMEEAIADAFNVPHELVRRVHMLTSDLGFTAKIAKLGGVEGLKSQKIVLFNPVKPMLAEKVNDLLSALKELGGRASLEIKVDGARVQVHKSHDKVKVFSRRATDVTASLPEVVEATKKVMAESAVLEGEVVALTSNGRPAPFQLLMRRFRRQKNVSELASKIPLRLYFFDILYLNGKTLIDEAYIERRRILETVVGRELVIDALITSRYEEAKAFYDKVLREGHEGLVAKDLEAPYTPGVRGKKWLKVKPVFNTLDLVVVAAEYGHGYRASMLSDLHLAAYNPESNEFEVVGKCFTGLTDEELVWITKKLKEIAIKEEGRTVYVEPRIVVEVAFDEVQKSPHYKSGLALRFPRITKIREDKSPFEADTIQTLRKIYYEQRGCRKA